MKRERSLTSVGLELTAVLLVTALVFAWGLKVVQAERGCSTVGGEGLAILIPPMYYIVKQMAMDWIADIREGWNAR